jgi:allantoinase
VLPTGRAPADIAIADGRISAIGAGLPEAAETINARGLIVLPGLVDGHVHFNEPGRTDWEGWEAGTRGAAAGGVTTVCEMPLNAHPPTTTAAAFDEKVAAAATSALVDFGLWGGFVGESLDHLDALHAKGVVAIKAFMSDSGIADFPRVADDALAAGVARAAALGALFAVHAESDEMTRALGADLRARRKDRAAWTASRPPAAELEAIGRFLACGKDTPKRARMHVVHVSTADGLAKLARARAQGRPVTAETCPHYLWFTDQDFDRIGPALKCAPPVRDAANRERLWRALLAGEVTLIGSDHSPCPAADKHKGDADIWQAWGGVAGIQATLPVLVTEGVHRRGLSWE